MCIASWIGLMRDGSAPRRPAASWTEAAEAVIAWLEARSGNSATSYLFVMVGEPGR
jgi:hypothetical protein